MHGVLQLLQTAYRKYTIFGKYHGKPCERASLQGSNREVDNNLLSPETRENVTGPNLGPSTIRASWMFVMVYLARSTPVPFAFASPLARF